MLAVTVEDGRGGGLTGSGGGLAGSGGGLVAALSLTIESYSATADESRECAPMPSGTGGLNDVRRPRLLFAGLAARIASSRFGMGAVLDGRPGGSAGGPASPPGVGS